MTTAIKAHLKRNLNIFESVAIIAFDRFEARGAVV